MTAQEVNKKEAELAAEVMSLSVGKLLLSQHYFSSAVGRLSLQQLAGSMLTDGRRICYDAGFVLDRFRQHESLPVHDLLHLLLHNIFRHWNIGDVNTPAWDAACDIVTEALISEISPELVPAQNAEKCAKIIHELSLEVKPLTAEKLYRFFCKNAADEQTLLRYSELFSVDDHRSWYKFKPQPEREYEDEEKLDTFGVSEGDGDTPKNKDKQGDGSEGENGENQGETEQQSGESEGNGEQENSLEQWLEQQRSSQRAELDKQWQEIAKQVQSELEAFGKSENGLQLIDCLEDVRREKTDYRDFLRRFAISGEVMKQDLDAFDVNFYCYGLQLYGDVAFIEPPEYKQVKRVRDFVVAIDTSGSVDRDLVHAFVQKTYNILKSEESFFSRVNIHLLQCDTQVRDIAVVASGEELEKYIDALELKGFGGTDFRPVFEYVDELRAQGELTGLKGIVYFTDAMGTFPEKAPEYETAFVFIRGDYEKNGRPEVPPWAVKIVLEEGDVLDV